MEPVEINAGTFYLRQLRADSALDDRPALLAAAGEWAGPHLPGTPDEAAAHVARRARQWADDEACAWAVAEPTTGELLGEVELTLGGTGPSGDADAGELAVWVRPYARGRGVAGTAAGAVLRFVFGGLGLRYVDCVHAPDDPVAGALARRCGFGPPGVDGDGHRRRRTADD